jgi:hypothetical protein
MKELREHYKKEAGKLGIAEHKIDRWWKSLTPDEKKGMKRMAVVGYAGAGVATILNPEATPLFVGASNLYLRPDRAIRSGLKKLRKVI